MNLSILSLHIMIFIIVLIIDCLFYRKKKQELKKVFYINLIIISIIFLLNSIFKMVTPSLFVLTFSILKLHFLDKNNIRINIKAWIIEMICLIVILHVFSRVILQVFL